MLPVWTSACFQIPLPDRHRFPIAKYALLRDAVLAEGLVTAGSMHEPNRASRQDILRAHDDAYLERLEHGTIDRASRVAIIDLDVHQGDGTNALYADDDRIFTFSMHGHRNYPFHKVPGRLDVELDDATGDDEYLERLAGVLPGVLRDSRPDIVYYLAGADPHEGDALGRLRPTVDGLKRRDRMAIQGCREMGVPVCVTIAGGYGRDIRDPVPA